ncbi:hypothetical protein L218DRAFT_1006799 [Marasmius fiardii PR-910]|nr:hypothetical protein L218DRAFT_1006799 [Marasmius fiardii PR-910]
MLANSRTHLPLIFISLILYFSTPSYASNEIRTIDDTLGDSADPNAKPVYLPKENWSAQPGGCQSCAFQPQNSELVFKGTWHDTTHYFANPNSSTIGFSFTGIALSVFCILPPKTSQAMIKNYNLTFMLDGQPVGPAFNRADSELTDSYQYNVSVLSLSNLPNSKHAFVMQLSDQVNSMALFDYATYIYNYEGTMSTEARKKSNLGAILGGVLGSIGFLAIAVLIFLYVLRCRAGGRAMNREHALDESASVINPFSIQRSRKGVITSSPASPEFSVSTVETEEGAPPPYTPSI